jgi:hypothetical protein
MLAGVDEEMFYWLLVSGFWLTPFGITLAFLGNFSSMA